MAATRVCRWTPWCATCATSSSVAALFSIPILLWSPIGRDVLGFDVPAPFGRRDDVFALILSLPGIFYSSWIFFDGALRALRARTIGRDCALMRRGRCAQASASWGRDWTISASS